jgi:hypothetical protein
VYGLLPDASDLNGGGIIDVWSLRMAKAGGNCWIRNECHARIQICRGSGERRPTARSNFCRDIYRIKNIMSDQVNRLEYDI